MRLVRLLPARWQRLAREATKFGIVGLINTTVDFIIFNLFLPVGPLKAKVVSTVIGTTVSYGLNRQWTFRHRDRASVRREYLLFFGLNLIGLAIQLAVLGAAKYGLGYDKSDRLAYNVVNCVGVGIAMVFRFWAYRTFVFKAATETGTSATPEAGGPAAPVIPQSRVAVAAPDGADAEFLELTGPLEAELGTGASAIDPTAAPTH